MPNHVTNVITASEPVFGAYLDDKGYFDCNKLIPMPECLQDFNPHHGILTRAKLALGQLPQPKEVDGERDWGAMVNNLEISNMIETAGDPVKPEDIPHIERAMRNYMECGFMYWYGWRVKHWGTKWGAYNQEPHDPATDSVRFDTAWSCPVPIIEQLAKNHPDVEFTVQFADEDTGNNCGTFTIKGDGILHEDVSPGWGELDDKGKAKWCKFAFELSHPGEDPRSHGYGPDWVYSDDIYEAWEAEQEQQAAS